MCIRAYIPCFCLVVFHSLVQSRIPPVDLFLLLIAGKKTLMSVVLDAEVKIQVFEHNLGLPAGSPCLHRPRVGKSCISYNFYSSHIWTGIK